MPSALELSVKFGLPLSKATQICEFLDVDTDADTFEVSKEFEIVARSVNRKRAGAYALAYVSEYAMRAQREFILTVSEEFSDQYADCDFPVDDGEKLPDAKHMIDLLLKSQGDEMKTEWRAFGDWIKRTVERAGRQVDHYYLAVRILLSLSENDMRDYPAPIASLLNKVRHRGHLEGWFDIVDRGGKRTAIYKMPNSAPIENPGVTDADLAAGRRMFGSDNVKIAGWLAATKKLDFEAVKRFLSLQTLDL